MYDHYYEIIRCQYGSRAGVTCSNDPDKSEKTNQPNKQRNLYKFPEMHLDASQQMTLSTQLPVAHVYLKCVYKIASAMVLW